MATIEMDRLDSFEKTLGQVEQDTARLRSDTNDIKTTLAVMRAQFDEVKNTVEDLKDSVFGNGKPGFDARMTKLEKEVSSNTEFRQDMKRFGWAIIGLLAGNILLSLINLPK